MSPSILPPTTGAPPEAPPLPVHHLAVVVRDLDRAEAFYAGALGLAVERRWPDEAGAPRSIWLTLGGGAFLAVERAAPGSAPRPSLDHDGGGARPTPPIGPQRASCPERRPQTPDPPGWHCVALGIPRASREAFRTRLATAGFPVERESPFTLYTRDPEGNLVGLSHYPEPA